MTSFASNVSLLRVKIKSMASNEQVEAQLLAETDEEIPGLLATRQSPPKRTVTTTSTAEPTDLAATFSLFKNYFDKKLVDLKDDLKTEAESATDRAAKKLHETAELSFRTRETNDNTSLIAVWLIK